MEKRPDQIINEWQSIRYKDEIIQLGQIDRYVKEGVTFLVCSLNLFIFWLIASHIIWVVFKLYTIEWSLFPQIIRSIPHKQLIISSFIVTVSAAFINCILKKIESNKSDFHLVKLFPKNAIKKSAKSSRS